MFASCCNWLCMDSGDVSPSSGPERRHQSFTNSPPEHTCKACGGAFDTPAKKHMCVDCKKNYCCRCSAQRELRPRLCHTCQRFYGNLLQRAELMKLKVKELRDYLHLHEVSTHLCREKEELVELVLSQQASPSSSFTPDTPIIDPATATSNLPDDLLTSNPPMPRISDPPTDVPIPASSTPEPEALLPESETPPPEPTLQDEDQVTPEQVSEQKLRCLRFIRWDCVSRFCPPADCSESGHGSAPPGLEENLCKICMDSPIDCVLLECGHMVTCTKCGKRMSECPICRQYVIRAVHVFRS
uniref:RING-type domain-containing protein n=1 Tax=Nothobranchius furzeri TaxID=105023 RepID=A0A8C6KC23_NOTFU